VNRTLNLATGAAPLTVTADATEPRVGMALTVTAHPVGGQGPLQYLFWRYRVNPPTWTQMGTYGSERSLTWIPAAGDEGATYHFQVWVKNAGSSQLDASANTNDFVVQAAQTLAVTSFTRSVDQVGAGMAVRFTATTHGGSGPLDYEFWRLDAGGWLLVQPYGPSPTYTWQTGESDGGDHSLQVWVRNAGSNTAYDAWAGMQVQVGAPRPLVVVTLTPDVSVGSLPAGTSVTWTAHADGGYGELEYAFFRYDESTQQWVSAQAYGPSPTYTWITTASDQGTHWVQVWVRQKGSTAAWDAWANADSFAVIQP
jgi:hypothetical protein